ncbi:MAG: DUF504 domain-containing protein [Candidatus Odinarchaeia archaeon]
MQIHEILNNLKWNPKLKDKDAIIRYIHRGAVDDYKEIKLSEVESIHKSYFTYVNKSGEVVVIPMHRILKIIDSESRKIIWEKSGKNNAVY